MMHSTTRSRCRLRAALGLAVLAGLVVILGRAEGFGDKLLMDKLSFSLPPGGIVGIIGPNGSGKTTLFRMITGQEKPDAGEFKTGASVKLAYIEQSRDDLKSDETIWQAISEGQEKIKLGTTSTPASRN